MKKFTMFLLLSLVILSNSYYSDCDYNVPDSRGETWNICVLQVNNTFLNLRYNERAIILSEGFEG